MAWRELGLEWLFRALREPRRYAWRYLTGNPVFLLRALRQRLASGQKRRAGRPGERRRLRRAAARRGRE
jgi:hypothetical protein